MADDKPSTLNIYLLLWLIETDVYQLPQLQKHCNVNCMLMRPQEQCIWNQINAFQIDDSDSRFMFSDRLAPENGWTKTYALRVVEEYKKFLFLCCVTDKGVTRPILLTRPDFYT